MKSTFIGALIIVSLSISLKMNAQDQAVFTVAASRGANTYGTSTASGIRLVTGTRLHRGGIVTITTGGYVALVYTSGKPVELKTQGMYAINELEKKVLATSASMVERYGKFVVSELTKKSNEPMAHVSDVVGGVERRVDDDIQTVSPIVSEVLGPKVKLSWWPVKGGTTYKVQIANINSEVLQTIETSETSIQVDLSQWISKGILRGVIWNITLKDNPNIESDFKALKFLSPVKFSKIQTDIQELKKELGEDSAPNQLILAAFYEEKGLIVDAAASYRNAIALQPDVQSYRDYYSDFLKRNGLDLEK
jgi:hypothetical protein